MPFYNPYGPNANVVTMVPKPHYHHTAEHLAVIVRMELSVVLNQRQHGGDNLATQAVLSTEELSVVLNQRQHGGDNLATQAVLSTDVSDTGLIFIAQLNTCRSKCDITR